MLTPVPVSGRDVAGRPPAPIVAAEVPVRAWEALESDPSGTFRGDICLGARLVRFFPGKNGGEVLTPNFESACEPEVSFDGKRVLFSGRPSAEAPWNIYELELDTGSIRQITRDVGNARQPRYLSKNYVLGPEDTAWFLILFAGDAAGEVEKDSGRPAWDLYTCELDGARLMRITYNPATDWDAFLMQDGRLLFASRQHGRPSDGRLGRMRILELNQDGTDQMPFTGGQGRRVQHMPTVTTDGLAVFVEADRVSAEGGGTLGSVLLRRPLHTYRALTGPEDGLFLTPSPLPEGGLLVSWRKSEREAYRAGRFDPTTGEWAEWASSPGHQIIYPRLVAPRPIPDGRSSGMRLERPHGQFYVLNINLHDLPERAWLNPSIAPRARLVEGIPRRVGDEPLESPMLPRRVLGEVPVEPDGSIFVEIPANVPVEFQLVDTNGLVLRTSEWIWTRNGIAQGCIGCHEDPELSPSNQLVEAVKKEPARLLLPPERRRTVDFLRSVWPIVERSCARSECHGNKNARLSLMAPDTTPENQARRAYELITSGVGETDDPYRGRWIYVGRARSSPLIWHVLGHDTRRPWDLMSAHGGESEVRPGVPGTGNPLLTPLEIRVLAEWIDFGAHWVVKPQASRTVAATTKREVIGDKR
ncbi:MAG TPA: hypothetical protein PLM33_04510 [Acidobacteriota bacterium]|nr:hypothetical protein [Acidobacteriota bacterium]